MTLPVPAPLRHFLFGTQRINYLAVVLFAMLQTACGILVETIPTHGYHPSEHNHPEDFEQFLKEHNAHREYNDLVRYLARQELHNIVPVWQLLKQGSDWRHHNLPKYAIPSPEKWDEMIKTLVFLKYDLLPHIGPVEVLSGFRTRHYNQMAGGARKSRHLSFSALDLKPVHQINRRQLHEILQHTWRNTGRKYDLGLGLYSSLRFHIDTGGHRQW